jgi:hypothetical protein|tara:strand:- start:240 stop:986 length:747 start_codon:yes stop_codon:yes gene_type:complete
MLTTINFTNRSKINKQHVKFVTYEASDGVLEFDVALDSFPKGNFPGDAKIYIEAHANVTRQIFDCGTVANLKLPTNRRLDELDRSSSPVFSLKIVEESDGMGRILASGEQFKANDDPNKEVELLPVVSHDLGEVPWKVDFSVSPHELIINSAIPNGIEVFKGSTLFMALVLPAAFKEILTYYLSVGNEDHDENSKNWMLLAESFGGKKPDDDDFEIKNAWVEDVISEFCIQHRWTDGLVSKVEEDSNQ